MNLNQEKKQRDFIPKDFKKIKISRVFQDTVERSNLFSKEVKEKFIFE